MSTARFSCFFLPTEYNFRQPLDLEESCLKSCPAYDANESAWLMGRIQTQTSYECSPRFGDRCCPRTTSKAKYTLAELVDEFFEQDGCCQCDEIVAYQNKPLKNAIIMAARADRGDGELHSHQKWLRPETAKAAESILLKCIGQIATCKEFDTLHELIKSKLNIPGAAEMYWYDTAFRIGISMGIYPKKVYLHRGTRDGAKNLGIWNGKDVLKMSELPRELQKLEPYQVEDFLCMCKDALKRCRMP
jgi:hypothetical protein